MRPHRTGIEHQPETARAVGYARLSRDTDESTSIARQRADIEREAERRGWELVTIHEDVDVSATRVPLDSRPGLNKVRAMIAAGEADTVIVSKLDRLTRDIGDFATLLDELPSIISALEPVEPDSLPGKMISLFAEEEARQTSLRVTSAIKRMKLNDDRHIGPIPYGYQSIAHPRGAGRALAIDDETAAIVREAAARVLAGETCYAVATDLNAREVPPPRKARKDRPSTWSDGSLRGILLGDAIRGHRRYRGELIRDERGHVREVWEPIITQAQGQALRELLAPRKAGEPLAPRRRSNQLLSGLIHCAGCGMPLSVTTSIYRERRRYHYTCRHSQGWKCEAPASVLVKHADNAVEEIMMSALRHAPYMTRHVSRPDNAELLATDEAIAHLQTEFGRAGADYAALGEQMQALQQDRARLAALPRTEEVRWEVAEETVGELWGRWDNLQRRELLRQYIDTIELHAVKKGASRAAFDRSRLHIIWHDTHDDHGYRRDS